jgi:threonyl-tRNA synthetase
LERFIGVLIEHFGGAFPMWLSPTQVKILTVTQRADEAAMIFARELKRRGYRVETDLRNEKLGYKIREARMSKTPYVLVIGDKEAENATVTAQKRGGVELGEMDVAAFVQLTEKEKEPPSWNHWG